ncbi:MAG: B12-binding domain-containing radical SAM protein [Thermoplasmata archaeon]|nr:B12-binding domain-containing radical SAM protein [Thermoplasmata archaeon]
MTEAGPGSPPRVLLVDPYMSRSDPMERKFVELYPSLGLLTLGAYLRSHGTQVSVVDLTFARDASPVGRALRTFRPHLVGVHTKTLTFDRAVEVARQARAVGAFTVAGGPDSASRVDTYLDSGFDAVVPGEGEVALTELATCVAMGRDPRNVAGVSVRREGKTVRGPHRPFLRDLDALPLPAWDLVDMDRYLGEWQKRSGERRAAVLTSRGCPFDCSWCSKPTFGRTFRQQSPARVVEELVALKERHHVDYVRFCDDVFGISRPWIEELIDRILASHLDLQFECLARVDLLKPDLLHRLRQAGLVRVYVGVESGSQKMLDLMNRGTKLAQVERTAEALRREGIRQFWFLMLGYPGETLEDIEATLRLFRRFSPEEYSVSIAVPIPGTRFHTAVKDRLLGRKSAPTRGAGGASLLYEAAYPESMYRWEQARFGLEAALGRARGRITPKFASQVGHVADRIHERVATPLLTGKKTGPSRAR